MVGALRRPILLGIVVVLAMLAVTACVTKKPYANDFFPTQDGTLLRGRIYGSGTSAIVLVHDYGSSQKVWEKLAVTLADRGFMVLTFDLRGHGDDPAGKKDVGATPNDTAVAVRRVRSEMAREHIFVIGEGVGGTAALKVAAQEELEGIVTLSSVSHYRGLDASTDIFRIKAPKLFIASRGDSDGTTAIQEFEANSREPKQALLVDGKGVGAALAAGTQGNQVRDVIIQFLTKYRSA